MLNNPVSEKIELITLSPHAPGTGDLETATKDITATSKQAVADYSHALTLPKSSDSRITVRNIAARLSVTRDSGTSTNLYCTVSVDSADGSTNLLFNAVDVQAASLQSVNLSSGAVFYLLNNGAEHTFYFFFWVDANNSVISLVQLWEVNGGTSTAPIRILQINHKGLMSLGAYIGRVGSGNWTVKVRGATYMDFGSIVDYTSAIVYHKDTLFISPNYMFLYVEPSVATDLLYLNQATVILRSEQ